MRRNLWKKSKVNLGVALFALGILTIPIEAEAVEQKTTEPIEYIEQTTPETTEYEVTIQSAEQETTDLSDFTNTLKNLEIEGTISNSFLSKTVSGYQAVLVDGKIHILDFDNNWNQISERIFEYELPVFGGYYAGETYNYLVFGQNGSSEGSEIYRVVKYDKDFNRIAALSVLYEQCYTTVPFYGGNVSIAETGNKMVVYTARKRPDGHQSNIALRINTDEMTIDNIYGMGAFPDIHVSHSFRQIVKYDGSNPVYVDLGDGYPRAVCLQETPGKYTNMLEIDGEMGDNLTDTDVSGLAITDTGYLVVGTQVQNYCNNIYLSYAEKGAATAQVIQLTCSTTYHYSNVCNAKIVEVADGKYAVMWNCHDSGGKVNYVMVNGQGELVSEMKSLSGAELTQCDPILDNGKVTWFKYENGDREIYSLTDFSCIGEYEWNDTYVSPVDSWDGSVDVGWYKEGQAEFTLTSPQQLAGLAQLVNNGNTFEGKKILLKNDMFFNEENSGKNSWIPIASASSGVSFEGTFDGQGHSLYNLYIFSGQEGGLFGNIGEQGIVKAVIVSQGFIEGAAIAFENNGWILFCENRSLIINHGDMQYTAGICCVNSNLVYGCGNSGAIMGQDAGGIVGTNRTAGATIDSCWNQGYVNGNGFAIGGIVSNNYGWVYDCYNTGTVSGIYGVNYAKTVAGIVGEHCDNTSVKKIYDCYYAGYLDIDDYWNFYLCDTVCGGSDPKYKNIYSISSKYNGHAVEVGSEELKSPQAVMKLQGEKVITKWCIDEESVNDGFIIPVAQQDMKDGVYKILPDVWGAVTEVEICLSDQEYALKAFRYVYYGLEEGVAVYNTDSDILRVTRDGIITPLRQGNAIVKVMFEEGEHKKKASFDVAVTITGMPGDINADGNVDLLDLMMCLNHVSKKNTLSGDAYTAADVNEDAAVDLLDLMRILNYVSKKSAEL